MVHSTAPILPSCNYCGNPTHKASECNIPSKDLFYDYCGISRSYLFCQVLGMEITPITMAKSASIFQRPLTNNQGTLAFHLSFPHQG